MNKMVLALLVKKFAPALAGFDVRFEGKDTVVVEDKKTGKVTRYRVKLEKIVE